MNTKNDQIGITLLFDDKKDLCVPARGELKLKFKNENSSAQKFTATIQSLRFDILEANYGEFPTQQFAKELAPGEEGSITIIDRGANSSVPDPEWFDEGWIRFGAGTIWGCTIIPTWIQKTIGLDIDEVNLLYRYPVYLIALKNLRSPGTDRRLKMADETPSYKELKEVFRQKKVKMEQDSNRYERMEEGYGETEEYIQLARACLTHKLMPNWESKNDQIDITLFFNDQKELCVPARGELKLKFRNEKKYTQKFTATIQSVRFEIVEANYGQHPTRQFAKELAPGEDGSITIIDRGPKPVESIKIDNQYFMEGRIRFGAGFSWKCANYPTWDGPDFCEPMHYRKGKLQPEADYMLASKNDEFPETDCCLVMEKETPSYKEMKKRVKREIGKYVLRANKSAEREQAAIQEQLAKQKKQERIRKKKLIAPVVAQKESHREVEKKQTVTSKEVCVELPTKTTEITVEPKPKPSPTVEVPKLTNQLPKKKKKCCTIL